MREPLSIAAAQPLCVPYDVAANAITHAAVIRAAGARVVLFPELSLTGYELAAPAVTARDPRLLPLSEACEAAGVVALAGAPVPGEAGRPHIGMLAIDPAGITVAYRKIWLARAEATRFAPGDKPAVLDVDGWRRVHPVSGPVGHLGAVRRPGRPGRAGARCPGPRATPLTRDQPAVAAGQPAGADPTFTG